MRSANKFRPGTFKLDRFRLGKFTVAVRVVALIVGSSAAAFLAACGMPAAPQPPSLHLPEPVNDLSAHRVGSTVTLTWTMPKRDTSKVTLKTNIAVPVRVCDKQSEGSPCATIANLAYPPGGGGSYTQTLPAELAEGAPRALQYFVELTNKKERSAGLSNSATVLAGQAPAPVTGLSAEAHKAGIVLHWTPGPTEPYATQIRLQRTLLTPTPAPKAGSQSARGPLALPAEPVKQDLLVPTGSVRGGALDKDIRFGEAYSYQAQRIAQQNVDGKMLELDGPLSPAIRVEAQNIFPPAVPASLAAVATPAENGAGPSIDLSWQPDTEPDLAGYAVYRREPAQQPTLWQRISGPQPIAGPGFHDPNVEPGHTYEYGVSAIGLNGHESTRSTPAEETVPGP